MDKYWLYKIIPRNILTSRIWQLPFWTIWGNDDDGIYGEQTTAGDWTKLPIGFRRFVAWQLRNPLHNFTFYIIGFAWRAKLQKPVRKILYLKGHPSPDMVFPFLGQGFSVQTYDNFPLISFRTSLLEGYIGWRERGNLGMKLRGAKQ